MSDSREYIIDAVRTEAPYDEDMETRLLCSKRLLHALIGIGTESGELLDQLKKHIFYGKDLDTTNLIEEVGDLFWYVGILCSLLDTTFEDIQRINIAKLRKRYPQKFTSEAALSRDLDGERAVLEEVESGEVVCVGTNQPGDIQFTKSVPQITHVVQESPLERLIRRFDIIHVMRERETFIADYKSSIGRFPQQEEIDWFFAQWWKREEEKLSRPQVKVN